MSLLLTLDIFNDFLVFLLLSVSIFSVSIVQVNVCRGARTCVSINTQSLNISRCFIKHYSKQQEIFSIAIMFCFSNHLAQTDNIVNYVRTTFLFFLYILPSATFTGRHARNSCFFDSLFFYKSYNKVALSAATISTMLFLVIGMTPNYANTISNMDKGCRKSLCKVKNFAIHES